MGTDGAVPSGPCWACSLRLRLPYEGPWLSPLRCPALGHLRRFSTLNLEHGSVHMSQRKKLRLWEVRWLQHPTTRVHPEKDKKLLQTPERGQVSGHISNVMTGSPLQPSAFLQTGNGDQMHWILLFTSVHSII